MNQKFAGKTKRLSPQKIAIISVLSLASLLMFFLLTQPLLPASASVSNFFKGIFGLAFYGIDAAAIAVCALLLAGKKIVLKTRYIVDLICMYFCIIFLVHLVTSQIYMASGDYASYLSNCFNYSATPTFGGVIGGIFVYPFAKIHLAFAYTLFVVGIVLTSFFAVNIFYKGGDARRAPEQQQKPAKQPAYVGINPEERQGFYPQSAKAKPSAGEILFGNKNPAHGGGKDSPLDQSMNGTLSFYDSWQASPKNYDTAPKSRFDEGVKEQKNPIFEKPKTPYSEYDRERGAYSSPAPKDGAVPAESGETAQKTEQEQKLERAKRDLRSVIAFSKNPSADNIIDGDNYSKTKKADKPEFFDVVGKNSNEIEEPDEDEIADENIAEEDDADGNEERISFSERPFETREGGRAYQTVVETGVRTEPKPYRAPSIDLLNNPPVDKAALEENLEENAKILEQTLAEFKIDAEVKNIVRGPAVTRYELSLAPGISIKKITSLTDDIARRMSAVDAVRLEPTISGKDLFGLEVPNRKRETVTLRSVIQSDSFNRPCGGLRFALGVDIGGDFIAPDLADMPHLLIAGSTGTGKSVCLNSLIISLMYRYSPEELRFVLVDPKRVEFTQFNNMPHLMINEVICDTDKTITVFNWAIDEMERRYDLFAAEGARDISSYNRAADAVDTAAQKLPRIVIVVDELSDLIIYNKAEIETRIKTLSAKARAAGIHLVLATQRPSVDIITGVIKANLPSRIAFKVTSMADSKTILDQGGPEKLLGKGDMLFSAGTSPKPVRLQGAFVSAGEVERVVEFIKQNNECFFDADAEKKILSSKRSVELDDDEQMDDLFDMALEYVIERGQASISMLQRNFKIGFNRAGKIIEDMVQKGYVSPYDGSKVRKVLITKEEYDRLIQDE